MQRERDIHKEELSYPLIHPQMPTMTLTSQKELRSLGGNVGLLPGWRGPKYMNRHLLFPTVYSSRRLDQFSAR